MEEFKFGTKEYFEALFKTNNPLRHKYYETAVEHAKEMAVHVDGTKPAELINEKRPNETDEVKKYRLKIWQPVTKSKSKKVISVISRIFNQKFYKIEIGEPATSRLKPEDTLENYLFKDYPNYRSLINYIKEVFVKKCLEDPNAICVVMPEIYSEEGQIEQPVPVIYESKSVVDFMPGEYYVIDVTKYSDKVKVMKRVKVITAKSIAYYDREGLLEEIPHLLGYVPVFRVGGVVVKDKFPYCYESFIAGVLPHWNNAIMTRSDYDGQLVLHAYLERWEYQSVDCRDCGGSGTITSDKGEKYAKQCDNCGGTGKVAKVTGGPYEAFIINRNAFEEGELPIPPAGYIEKDISIIDKLKEEYESEIEAGLNAINMDIINKVGEDQSGIAKTIDRQDLDSFLQQFSDHIFDYVIPNIIDSTISWRYVINQVLSKQKDYPYTIQKPTRFDVFGIAYMMEEYKMAKESDIDTSVITQMQLDLVEKMFSGDAKKKAKLIIMLDPLPGKTQEDIMVMSASGVVRREDWKLKAYLPGIVTRAVSEVKDFLEMPLDKQREIVLEKLAEIDVEAPTIPNEA